MAIIQEDENSNTSHRRVLESSEWHYDQFLLLHISEFHFFVFKTLEITKLKTITTGICLCFENYFRVIGDTFKVLLLNIDSIFI
jgi:hypothetical protein